MALTQEEIDALVERKLFVQKVAIVETILKFCRSPSAKTFRDAEDIPDRLTVLEVAPSDRKNDRSGQSGVRAT